MQGCCGVCGNKNAGSLYRLQCKDRLFLAFVLKKSRTGKITNAAILLK